MTDTATPRRKRQPTADVMREQLALAASELIRWKELAERESPTVDKSAMGVVFCLGGFITDESEAA
jgi:hypothetical protein